MGYLFNHPRREEDEYKDGTRCCIGLDPEYDVSRLKEGSLALTQINRRGMQSVYRLGTQKEQKPQREDWESRDEWREDVLRRRIVEKQCLGGEDTQNPNHSTLTNLLELRELRQSNRQLKQDITEME